MDLAAYLTGAVPVKVHARGTPDAGRYREDNVVLTLTMSDGSVVSIAYVASGDRALGKERFELFGGGRSAVVDDFREMRLFGGGKRVSERARLSQDKGHRAEWEVLRRVLTQGGPPPSRRRRGWPRASPRSRRCGRCGRGWRRGWMGLGLWRGCSGRAQPDLHRRPRRRRLSQLHEGDPGGTSTLSSSLTRGCGGAVELGPGRPSGHPRATAGVVGLATSEIASPHEGIPCQRYTSTSIISSHE